MSRVLVKEIVVRLSILLIIALLDDLLYVVNKGGYEYNHIHRAKKILEELLSHETKNKVTNLAG